MILEGIVTTLSAEDRLNVAPMGPEIGPELDMATFEIHPFRSSVTYQNLKASGEGVFHVTDDVLLLAQSAIGAPLQPAPELIAAQRVRGSILAGACRYYEFRVMNVDDSSDRARFRVQTLAAGRLRDFAGFNRARHAVVEAAILATRTALLPRAEILSEMDRLAVIVTKTGGPKEEEALRILQAHVLQAPEVSSAARSTSRS